MEDDGYSQNDKACRNRETMRRGIRTGYDPGVKATCRNKMEVNQIMNCRVHHHNPVERRKVEGCHSAQIQGKRGYRVGPHPSQRSEEHTSELQSLMRISYAVFCLKKKK